jgi:hypothetical protein
MRPADSPPVSSCGHLQTAAVLVALYETPEKDGLRVLLTTRATTLRYVSLRGTLRDPTTDQICDLGVTQVRQYAIFLNTVIRL